MDTVVPLRIQILSIIGSVFFLLFIGRLILRGKLREEYAIIWVVCTVALLVLSFWRAGLDRIAALLGVFYAPSLIFLAALFAVGIAKGRVTRLSLLRSGLQVTIVGSISAGVGYAIGHLVTTLSG